MAVDHGRLNEAALKLRNFPEFSVVKEYLADEQAQALKTLAGSSDDRAIHVAQGAFQQLQRIIDLIENSQHVLEKKGR